MAIYVPAARRRRRLLAAVAVSLIVGILIGGVLGRATAPTLDERVREAQQQGRSVSAQLRVLSLHQEAGAQSLESGQDAGQALALRRARGALQTALRKAPWIPPAETRRLLRAVDDLVPAGAAPGRAGFAEAVERAAAQIDAAFGLTG